jgi:beta-glucanase (GH16 family)
MIKQFATPGGKERKIRVREMHISHGRTAMFVLLALSATTYASELLVNGGFEGVQTGWSKWGSNATVVSDAGYFYSSGSAVTYWVDSGFYQSVTASPGDSFTLSGKMIYPSANPLVGRRAYIKIEFWNGATQLGFVEVGVMNPEDSANQWHSYSGDVTTPASTTQVRVVLLTYDIGTQGSGSGWAYFDDISLTKNQIPKGPDYNNDQTVDFLDLAYLGQAWLTTSAEDDLNGDNFVNSTDFAIFAQAWKYVIPSYSGYHLVWSDEFFLPTINSANWTNQIMGDGGNQELQYYTSRPVNSRVENGHLVIEARREDYVVGGQTYRFTSARLRTAGKQDFLYGKIEARIKLPKGTGLWPAFWMMPTDSVYGVWAASGEIDVMESSNQMSAIGEALHFGGTSPNNTSSTSTYYGTDFSADYHIYTLVWEPNVIRFYVDGLLNSNKTSWWSGSKTNNGTFPKPFNQRFHILLNVAVGGTYPQIYNWQDVTTNLPQQMFVDWVRVYQKN